MKIYTSLLFLTLNFLRNTSGDELIFVQAIWRHGDRNPLASFPNDPYKYEGNWTEGWGELTIKGMEQHFNLGRNLSGRYMDKLNFINHGPYNSHEIYVRSTDVNRTTISAMSNLIGFYYNQGKNGTNYPNIAQWPQGYVPIAVHSFDYDNDHIGNPDATCKRQDDIWKLAQQTPEYQNFVNNATFKASLAQVQNLTGWTDLNFENMWYIDDTLYIEHFVYNLTKVDTNLLKLFDFINLTTDINYDWTNGWGLTPYKGINFTEELRKVRGGTLLWSIIDLMNNKIYCRTNPTDTSGLCNWMNKLKYYAYSAHDTTLAALFATFGFKRPNYNEDGYPHYSSCVTVELWLDNNTKPYVKVLYWPLNQDIEYVTQYITGCNENCSLDKFINRSLPYRPGNDGNIVEWCNVPLLESTTPETKEESTTPETKEESTTPETKKESTTPETQAGMSIRILNLVYNFILIMCLIIALLI